MNGVYVLTKKTLVWTEGGYIVNYWDVEVVNASTNFAELEAQRAQLDNKDNSEIKYEITAY